MTKDKYAFKLAQVESIDDNSEGGRIKARTVDDGNDPTSSIPYAFPLMPKMFHVIPKVGECVLLMINEEGNKYSDRFYIGPIISQKQYFEKESYDYGRGSSSSLLKGGGTAPLQKLSMYDSTRGSYPNDEDISMIGRTSEDVILKKGEIDIRCGIRGKAVTTDNNNNNLQGYVIFNETDPAYIQLKREDNLCTTKYGSSDRGTNSVVNVVADKINLISHSDPNRFDLTNKDELITKDSLQTILDNAHPAAYADEIIKVLNIMRNCIITHVHPYNSLPSCNTSNIQELANYDMNKIKSNFVRIS